MATAKQRKAEARRFWKTYGPPLVPPDGGNWWIDTHNVATIKQMYKKYGVRRLWTIIDGEGSSVFAVGGYHFVNRLGYFFTTKAWKNTDEAFYI